MCGKVPEGQPSPQHSTIWPLQQRAQTEASNQEETPENTTGVSKNAITGSKVSENLIQVLFLEEVILTLWCVIQQQRRGETGQGPGKDEIVLKYTYWKTDPQCSGPQTGPVVTPSKNIL